MCDYSLHNVRNRLAVEGEPLQVHRFPTGSLGLACPADLRPSIARLSSQARDGWRQTVMNWFSPTLPTPAVCVPPGAQLVLREIPRPLQKRLGVGAEEEVTFTQLSAVADRYRDAIRFHNGQEILIQELPVGLQLDVLCLSVSNEEDQRMPTEAFQSVALSRSSF